LNENEIRQLIRSEVRALIEPLRDAVADLTAERRSGKVLTAETDDLTLEALRERDWSQAGLSRHTIEQIEQEQAPTVLTVDDDPDETLLSAENYAGVPLAAGFMPGRPVISEALTNADYTAFAPVGSPTSGTVDRSDAARRLGQLIAEGQQRKQLVDEAGEPVEPQFLVRW
jgi:hypothetical protein